MIRVGEEISCFSEKEEQNSIYYLHNVGKLLLIVEKIIDFSQINQKGEGLKILTPELD